MPRPYPELDEKDFISSLEVKKESSIPPPPSNQGGGSSDYTFYLLWVAIVAIIALFMWKGSEHFHLLDQKKWEQSTPFLQVSNRDFSLFLWQNPEFMRGPKQRDLEFLREFSADNLNHFSPADGSKYVTANPETLFLYHTWNRLLGDYVWVEDIPKDQFQLFTQNYPEWLPENWPEASKSYSDWINGNPGATLPKEVRLAYQGWKNFFIDQGKINSATYTGKQVEAFLDKYPNYQRSYWINIIGDRLPSYLKNIELDKEVPKDFLGPLLRIGLYNNSQNNK